MIKSMQAPSISSSTMNSVVSSLQCPKTLNRQHTGSTQAEQHTHQWSMNPAGIEEDRDRQRDQLGRVEPAKAGMGRHGHVGGGEVRLTKPYENK